MHALDDAIVAIATAPGAAGLAVVRVSGAEALSIAGAVFRGARLDRVPSHTLHHGWVVDPASDGSGRHSRTGPKKIDEVVAAVFRAPRSYTREDVVELSCHGGRACAEGVLAALVKAGARLAAPGEFTLRAFLNGRIDLAQAEAVADLIHAETESARELALSQLAGALSRRLEGISERLTDALSEVEARVDFAEDVGGIEVPTHVGMALAEARDELDRLLEGAVYARAIREGVRVPIVGRPNVGKSALFNALVGEERAIVTATPGTTRDRVSEAIEVDGVRVTLSDTAGLRPALDQVEAIGVERTRSALGESRAVLWVVDGSESLELGDHEVATRVAGKRVVVALNKSDLPRAVQAREVEGLLEGTAGTCVVVVSAARGSGLDALRRALAGLLDAPGGSGALGSAVGNARHVDALTRARAAVQRAVEAAEIESPGEIVALELREALSAVGEVTGKTVAEDLLDRIFSRFCIGK